MMKTRRLAFLVSRFSRKIGLLIVVCATPSVVAIAQGDVELRIQGQPLHPILGSITDDSGPFWNVVWGNTSNLTTQWSLPPQDDGKDHEFDAAPSILYNPVSGYPVAVWHTEGAEKSGDVRVSYFTVGGWSAPFVAATGAAEAKAIVDGNSGSIHLVYTSRSTGAVWHREATADLSTWTDPQRISDEGNPSFGPAVAIHGATLTIAYETSVSGRDSAPKNIVVAQADLRASNGGARDYFTTVLATIYSDRDCHIRLDGERGGGRLLVRWIQAPAQFGWVVQSPRGVWGPVAVEPWPSEPELSLRQPRYTPREGSAEEP